MEQKPITDCSKLKTEGKRTQDEVESHINKLLGIQGNRSAMSFHKELGEIMWDKCGMARNKEGLQEALEKIPKLREEFWPNLKMPGGKKLNQQLEKAGRVADFLEFGELMCQDALEREEILWWSLQRRTPN